LIVERRDQKEILLLKADTTSGKTTPLVIEEDKDWINLYIYKELPDWLNGFDGFLWATERDGGPALELRDSHGKFIRTLVNHNHGFMAKVDSDGKNARVSYLASTDPTQCQLFEIDMGDCNPIELSKEQGIHSAIWAKDHSIYTLESTSINKMPSTSVYRANGSLIGTLPSVAENPPVTPHTEMVKIDRFIEEYAAEDPYGTRHYHHFEDGLSLGGAPLNFYACIVRPQNFDPQRKYPVIVDVYGGPGTNKVLSAERPWLLTQWLADQGFITVTIDGRGTPHRGRNWERSLYLHFGSVPLDDQVEGLKALGRKYHELDLTRVGITGWSFGGYMSALAVLRRPDIFKAGVAGAPVVDWLDYDTHYTERYLGLPDANPQAYKDASLLTYANDLKRPLLVVHGTTDDNVFFRHSLKLSNALFRAGGDFELLPLSGLTHMVPDAVVTQRLWSKIAEFFHQHL
jgi:dipeptidyl-peptidase-4